jgi:hypothetical protein
LQMQRGEVIKCSAVKISWRQSRQIWQVSKKCWKPETNLFAFELFGVLFFGFSHYTSMHRLRACMHQAIGRRTSCLAQCQNLPVVWYTTSYL